MSNIDEKIVAIKSVFNPQDILLFDTAPKQIAKYYRLNRLAYWLFVSRKGFVHMGLSENDKLDPEDFSRPAQQISEHINKVKARNVLELAVGKGGNLRYLAKKHPKIHFYGIDLPNGQTNDKSLNKLPNLEFSHGDFHDLSIYKSSSQDVVFVIEALCYAQPKQKVMQEVYRILKPGGTFIVYDGYNLKPYKQMRPNEALIIKLGWKGMLVNPDDMYLGDFKKYLLEEGFSIAHEEDLGRAVIPSLKNLEKHAARFFRRPKLARLINKFLPDHFVANAISGYVMPDVVESRLCTYNLTIAQK